MTGAERPKIRLIGRGTYECKDAEVSAAGRSFAEAYQDWTIAKVARARQRMAQPHVWPTRRP